jgi:hypothetical protein
MAESARRPRGRRATEVGSGTTVVEFPSGRELADEGTDWLTNGEGSTPGHGAVWPRDVAPRHVRSHLEPLAAIRQVPAQLSRMQNPAPGPSMLLEMHRLGFLKEVVESRSLLDREDDWDDMGSPGYLEATWNRAVDFMLRLAINLRDSYHIRLNSAEIMPGSYGSIDLELRTSSARLLVSVPPTPEIPARFYAHDDSKTRVVKGTIDTSTQNGWLAEWLAE